MSWRNWSSTTCGSGGGFEIERMLTVNRVPFFRSPGIPSASPVTANQVIRRLMTDSTILLFSGHLVNRI